MGKNQKATRKKEHKRLQLKEDAQITHKKQELLT